MSPSLSATKLLPFPILSKGKLSLLLVDLDFVFVHVIVTDGRFLSAGSNQLRQDLGGVDRHRPNLLQEVQGLDVRT